MNNRLNESRVETVTVEYFRGLGYEYVHGPSIAPDGDAPERTNYGQVVLIRRLRDALRRINPDMQARATELVLEQAAVLCGAWTK